MSKLLEGKVVIVTGIGPGFGRVLAREAAELGACVAMVSRSGDIMDEVEREIAGIGGKSLSIRADITNDQDCIRVAAETKAAFNRIDGLVNSAYRPGDIKPVLEIDLEELERAHCVTVLGTLRMIRAVTPVMKENGGGSIVNIGSQVARKTVLNQGGYASLKSGVSALTRQLAVELGPDNIRVNTAAFGWTIGPPARAWLEQQEADGGPTVEQSIGGIASTIALGRVPGEQECSQAALTLIADAMQVVTGATLDINGGEFMPL